MCLTIEPLSQTLQLGFNLINNIIQILYILSIFLICSVSTQINILKDDLIGSSIIWMISLFHLF